jgi:hypothetical protein
MRNNVRSTLLFLACIAGPLWAQAPGDRPSCAALAALDLKPLLGGDHEAPVPFGEFSCRAQSKDPGRMLILMLTEKPPAELKAWMAKIREVNTTEQANEVTVASEPALGADAFSIADKGQRRGAEIYAIKGARAIVLQADWSVDGGITEAALAQLRNAAQAALARLP